MTAHGTANAYSLGCRCPACCEAKDGSRRRGPWGFEWGRPIGADLQPCGTVAAYGRGCRCAECRQANNEYRNRYRYRGRRARLAAGWVPRVLPGGCAGSSPVRSTSGASGGPAGPGTSRAAAVLAGVGGRGS